MNRLRTWTETNFATLILLFTATGFVFLLAELLLEQHWEGVQLVAPIATAAGLALVLLALTGRRSPVVVMLLLVLSVTGLFGTYKHFEERTETREGPPGAAVQSGTQAAEVIEVSESVNTASVPAGSPGVQSGPPWLAALALSGLSLLGGAATLAGGRRRERPA